MRSGGGRTNLTILMSFKQQTEHVVYHILPKGTYVGKVGATGNVKKRVEEQQGAKIYGTDYVVLRETDDLRTASDTEIHFQKLFGYPVDPTNYFDIKSKNTKKMKKLEYGPVHFQLAKNLQWYSNYQIEDRTELVNSMLNDGVAIADKTLDPITHSKKINSLVAILQKSRWDGYYLAARAVDTLLATEDELPQWHNEVKASFDLIREWAIARNLYEDGDTTTQTLKLGEEYGELCKAVVDRNDHEFKDAIGDMVVVLTNLAHLGGTSIEECIDLAYNEIKDRKGRMINGTFVKEENLPENEGN